MSAYNRHWSVMHNVSFLYQRSAQQGLIRRYQTPAAIALSLQCRLAHNIREG